MKTIKSFVITNRSTENTKYYAGLNGWVSLPENAIWYESESEATERKAALKDESLKIEEIETTTKKYALASTVKDGLLCKQGHNYEVSNGDDYESEYEASLVLFDTEAEAMRFIEQHGYWALEPVEYAGEE